MDEVNNPKRLLAKKADLLFQYDESNYKALLDTVFDDVETMASKYNINLDRDRFEKNIESLFISVHDYSGQTTFLKELVKIGKRLRNESIGSVQNIRIGGHKVEDSEKLREGVLLGLLKELEAFYESEKNNNIILDRILFLQLRSYLMGEEIKYPMNYYGSVEDYLFDSIEFSYKDMNRKSAALALASCFLETNTKDIISVKKGAFIYDLLYYTGYVNKEQWKDKNLESYMEKCKYDMVKRFFKK